MQGLKLTGAAIAAILLIGSGAVYAGGSGATKTAEYEYKVEHVLVFARDDTIASKMLATATAGGWEIIAAVPGPPDSNPGEYIIAYTLKRPKP